MLQNVRQYYNIRSLLADLGGFTGSIYGFFYLIGAIINRNFIILKISRAIYFYNQSFKKKMEKKER